ncbi:MAG: aminopeptidase P family protein [Dehalococcoidia bacterium]|nr:aminopeptidase P family protein [Dehalococcoidia bacterium]
MTVARVAKLREKLPELGVDAFFVSTPENRRYLSGFSGSAGYLLITQQHAILATDFRYIEQGGRQATDFRVHRIGAPLSWVVDLLKETGARKIAFESENLTVGVFNRVRDAVKDAGLDGEVTWTPTTNVVGVIRAVKDAGELKLIERACQITDLAFDQVTPTIEPGETEKAVAWRLEKVMREAGAEALAFETIVASGPNAALPHHLASDKPLRQGEPIVIDFGARYDGYHADMTRTICLGKPDDTLRKVYDIVLGAQLTASETVCAGMTGGQADKIARDIIDKAGYGDKFGHSLGHGVGLAIHESPWLGPNQENKLTEEMPFTIEPGIYIPGWGGVRIEDTVVMEKGRVRAISKAHKFENPR